MCCQKQIFLSTVSVLYMGNRVFEALLCVLLVEKPPLGTTGNISAVLAMYL